MNYNRYQGPGYEHGDAPAVGVLLTNLGTPDAPDAPSLRRYLRQFLSDPRVIELPRWLWWPILNGPILLTRPKASAALYREVWTDEGSPLLSIGRKQAAGVETRLRRRIANPLHVELGMGYGSPSIAASLQALRDKGCRRVLCIPLYPQYSGTTTGTSFDCLFSELKHWRWVPDLRTVGSYHDDSGYIRSLAASIAETWQRDGEPERLLFSFHGVPLRYITHGDPYHCHCHKTARLVAERLELPPERYVVAFQSQFGKEEWIKPTTDVTVRAIARSGIRRLDVVCPGFSADCLETLEEIQIQNKEFFIEDGGEAFRYIPCLNDRDDHLEALADLAHRHLQGWVTAPEAWDGEATAEAHRETRRRAEALLAAEVRADGGFGS